MMRFLSIALLSACMAGCGSQEDSATESNNDGAGLNPTAITLDTPPANGKLPADLLPPA
jgi:hypothetical protein